VNIQEYIESGILEAYVLGSASDAETRELLHMKDQFPQVRNALEELELDMERIAEQMAIMPPPNTWAKIEQEIHGLIEVPELKPAPQREFNYNERQTRTADDRERYIEVESSSEYMRIHKQWKWVFAAVFVLGKIFLACAIYFYLENRQAQEQIKELKSELSHYRVTP
jgi:hypothetical protein